MLDTEVMGRGFHSNRAPPPRPAPITLGFICDDPADVDTTFRLLIDTGYEPTFAP